VLVSIKRDAQALERFLDPDGQRSDGRGEVVVQWAGHPHVRLLSISLGDEESVGDTHVLVDAHAHERHHLALRVDHLEPMPVIESVVGRPRHAKRP
jgi:hypothetical protein